MISINDINSVKELAGLQADIIPGGVIFLIFEGDTITWRRASRTFDLDFCQIGYQYNENSIAGKAFRENRTCTEDVPKQMYGTRLKTIAEPILNDEGQPVGVFSIVLPRLHPVATAFSDFAPILADIFPEGAFLYLTDLHKVMKRQASKKFDVSMIDVDKEFAENETPALSIRSKKPAAQEYDSSHFGIPVLESCYPLFDEDNPDEVVATLGVVIPKVIASNLKQMSEDLEGGVTGIASAIEELAASATSIHTNEKELNREITQVTQLLDEINEISSFIKDIADETKMLGLNAAIEAARAGEAGKGFGVVAEEIRKLSEESKSTVPKIKQLTDRIQKTIEETCVRSQSSLESSEEQAAATEEITASVEQITSMSSDLNRIAQSL